MAYSTEEDVRKRVPSVPDEAVGDSQIAEGIAVADAEIDGRLMGRYTVPFSPVPALVKSISVDLAAAWALSSAYSGTGPNDQVKFAEYLESRARQMLELLVNGEILLSVGATTPTRLPAAITTFGQKPKTIDFDPYGATAPSELPGL